MSSSNVSIAILLLLPLEVGVINVFRVIGKGWMRQGKGEKEDLMERLQRGREGKNSGTLLSSSSLLAKWQRHFVLQCPVIVPN